MTHREARLIVVDRSFQISVIVFDYASMPFNFVVERILLKSIVIDGRDLNPEAIADESVPNIARNLSLRLPFRVSSI
jgi:hypothetical protein